MPQELSHHAIGNNIAVDNSIRETLKVFNLIRGCLELDSPGYVLDHGEFQLTGPLSEFTPNQFGGLFRGECLHHILSQIQEPAPIK